jgi:hypothetical protein
MKSISRRYEQWDRIWINENTRNIINHAVIKNAFIGIQAEILAMIWVINYITNTL